VLLWPLMLEIAPPALSGQRSTTSMNHLLNIHLQASA